MKSPLRRLTSRVSLCVRMAMLLPAILTMSHAAAANERLELRTRYQQSIEGHDGAYRVVEKSATWDPTQTAIIICDMWDAHWCQGASRRVAEMAPRMNETIAAARKRGVLIIHAPSETMDFYAESPQRKLAQEAPTAENVPEGIESWCGQLDDRDLDYPIDQSDGGCDCSPTCRQGQPWRRQVATLKIHDGDAISDSGVEIWNLLEDRGIQNVIVLGVHTNMCVLGRPFGIRNLVRFGKNVVLCRDLTDTMYNSRSRPYVNHFTGNDLIVEHIERHWCPTISSASLAAGGAFRSAEDTRTHLAIVMAEDEYDTHLTLPRFARQFLGRDFKTTLVFENPDDIHDVPGIGVLDEADAALLSIRRRILPKEQLDAVRRFVAAGKPLAAIRTTSHAFSPRGNEPTPEGKDTWPEFDHEVLGGNYHGHHGNKDGEERTLVWSLPGAEQHPVMTGVPTGQWFVPSWLYKTNPLAESATELLRGRVGERQPDEPVTWTNTHQGGGRVFYTSLGHVDDFELAGFRRLLLNGIYWSAGLEVPRDIDAEGLATK